MDLIIDGKKAVLKKGSSFDYISENRSFSDADDYTMSITLPLAGCPENIAIFGHLDRMDVDSRYVILDASIIDRAMAKNGIITVVEASNTEVKCQFLEGRSVQNYMTTFDDIYINELDLGSYPSDKLPASASHYLTDIDHGAREVALPWVNDGSADINNEMIYQDGTLQWAQFTIDTGKLSFQPYLIVITKQICEKLRYTFDFSQWEQSDDRFLIICNTLPAAWDIPQYARALPHWTVTEFFEELEKILVCEISIDHRARHIDLAYCDRIEQVSRIVKIENVVDDFSSEVSYNDELCQYKGLANIGYKSRGDSLWNLEQCQWLVDQLRSSGKYYTELQTEEEWGQWFLDNALIYYFSHYEQDASRGDVLGQLIHVVELDKYFLWRFFVDNNYSSANCFHELIEVNRFGDVIYDKDSDNKIEIAMIPARIDLTDNEHGQCLFLAPSGYDENEDLDDNNVRQPAAYSTFMKGDDENTDKAEYYDAIILAYWDGSYEHTLNNFPVEITWPHEGDLPPVPTVDSRFALRRRYANYLSGIKISQSEKIKVSWLSSSIPDVRSTFYINGKLFLCEKITATFTEDGMSQLLKGEFYPIV